MEITFSKDWKKKIKLKRLGNYFGQTTRLVFEETRSRLYLKLLIVF